MADLLAMVELGRIAAEHVAEDHDYFDSDGIEQTGVICGTCLVAFPCDILSAALGTKGAGGGE